MKIAIESSPQLEVKRGIGIYTENLVRYLAKIDMENEYVIFSWFFRDYEKKLKMLYCPKQKNFSMTAKRFPDSLMTMLEWKLHLPVIQNLLKKENIGIYHSPGPRLPHFSEDSKTGKARKIATIHDVIHEIHPEWFSPHFIKTAREAIKSADFIITDSVNSKHDLIKYYALSEEKIKVIPLGIDRNIFKKIEDKESLKHLRVKYGLPHNYFLCVGPIEPRKNIENFLAAYSKIIKPKMPEHKIVLVGRKNAYIEEIINRHNLSEDVIITGVVGQNDIVGIYNLAAVLVHPSLYEGFGMQVLEAMTCGCPVVTSDSSSLPELAGDACLLVNPHSIEEIADAVYRIVSDEKLRTFLSDKGLKRAKNFKWEDTARQTLEIYRKYAS